jgi:hypothetical protein
VSNPYLHSTYTRATPVSKDSARASALLTDRVKAFQTAVALAEYEAERDEDGKIQIRDDHLMSVVELSKDFDDYLAEVHKKTEAARAQMRHERAVWDAQ